MDETAGQPGMAPPNPLVCQTQLRQQGGRQAFHFLFKTLSTHILSYFLMPCYDYDRLCQHIVAYQAT